MGFAIIQSPNRILSAGEQVSITTVANGTSDPAGINDALDRVARWTCRRGSEILVNVLEGRYTYTSPIVVTQANGPFVRLKGTSISVASTGGPIQVRTISAVSGKTNLYDIEFEWFTSGQTTGMIVGNLIKIIADSSVVGSAARFRELSLVGRLMSVSSATKKFVIRVCFNKAFDAAAIVANAHTLTNIRVLRTTLFGAFTWAGDHQGLFDVYTGIQLESLGLDGGRIEVGSPSTGAHGIYGTADTAGVRVRPGAYLRGRDYLGIIGWDYGIDNNGGTTYCEDVTVGFCNNNGFYGQDGARFKHLRGAATGCNVGAAIFSGSSYIGPENVFSGNDTGVRAFGNSLVQLDSTSFLSSNGVGIAAGDEGRVLAVGADLDTSEGRAMNNTTKHTITRSGYVSYNDAGTPVVSTTPT